MVHARNRAVERYGMDVGLDGIQAVNASIQANRDEWIGVNRCQHDPRRKVVRLYEVRVDGRTLFPVYDEGLGTVVTFLDSPVGFKGTLYGEDKATRHTRLRGIPD